MTIRLTIRIVRLENKKYKYKIVVENLNAEWLFGKIRCTDEDNIKMHFTEIVSMCRLDCPVQK
jgi:hypothetical protein